MSAAHHLFGTVVFLLLTFSVTSGGAQSSEKLRPHDSVNITVADQPTLSKKYEIGADGFLIFPFVGRIQAAERTADQLAGEIRQRLADGLYHDPQVSVAIERQRRVFIFGGVSAPGMFQLTDNMTLMELLARAGYLGASEAVIVRSKAPRAPGVPGDEADEVIRVNLRELERELEAGQLSRNVLLADGDTIYVPRFDPNRVYVSGQVRTPGAYSVPEKTTVLQALAMAGGPTEQAALGRVRIIRIVDGKQKTIDAKLEDTIRPGDTVIVPERYF